MPSFLRHARYCVGAQSTTGTLRQHQCQCSLARACLLAAQCAPPDKARSEQEWIEAVHSALRTAVKRRLDIADVPVGVLLSGGLDSSLLVGLLAEAGATDLKTFTVGFDDQPEEKGSEFEYSDPVVEKFATDHHQFLSATTP